MSSANTDSRALDFLVRRRDLREYKFVDAATDEASLQPDEVLLKVDKFAFTANNITYAVFGDRMSYWDFFPAEEGWGKIPVWGFADVMRSNQDAISEGERIYGYFPLSTHVILQPEKVKASSFIDAAAHRKALPAAYNRYSRVANDWEYEPEFEELQALLRPLFVTSFLLDDFLADNDFFGAQTLVLSSASSKTAFGVAFLLTLHREQRSAIEVIGLTSQGNVEFVEQLGCYDRVLSYDAIQSLSKEQATTFVDIAGNAKVRTAIHHHVGDNMKYSCQVGISHWDKLASNRDLPGPQPTFFFAPTQLEKRIQEWGASDYQKRYGEAWKAFLAPVQDWIGITAGRGKAAVESVYLDMLEGRSKPDQGHILSLWD